MSHGSHAAFSMHPHAVRITSCREKLLWDEVPFRVREICRQEDAETVKFHAPQDHVRLFFVRRLKGKMPHKLLSEHPHLRKTCRGRHFWARGCFCRSKADEAVRQHIEGHGRASDDDFKIDG